jgi:hypothetical protein
LQRVQISTRHLVLAGCIITALSVPAEVAAAEEHAAKADHSEVSDLGILDSFTNGWNEDAVHRHRSTPDMALLRVTTNFLEREFRLDYTYTDLKDGQKYTATNFVNGLMAFAVNRRLMLEVISNYQWNISATKAPVHGSGAAGLARFQLIDTATASYSFQMRVSAPNRGIGQTQTTLSYFLAGWQDVAAWFPELGRVGLYYSFEYDNLVGPHATGATENSMSYAVSVARTWTQETTPVFRNLTTFLEFFGTSPLDGNASGKTALSLTPGIRFWFVPKNSLTAGLDIPLNDVPTFSAVWRATYILNF